LLCGRSAIVRIHRNGRGRGAAWPPRCAGVRDGIRDGRRRGGGDSKRRVLEARQGAVWPDGWGNGPGTAAVRMAQIGRLRLENRILKQKAPGRIRFTDEERRSLVEAALAMGRSLIKEAVGIVKPETIPAWQRRLERSKWDYSARRRRGPGRPRTADDIEALICRLAGLRRASLQWQASSSWATCSVVGQSAVDKCARLGYAGSVT